MRFYHENKFNNFKDCFLFLFHNEQVKRLQRDCQSMQFPSKLWLCAHEQLLLSNQCFFLLLVWKWLFYFFSVKYSNRSCISYQECLFNNKRDGKNSLLANFGMITFEKKNHATLQKLLGKKLISPCKQSNPPTHDCDHFNCNAKKWSMLWIRLLLLVPFSQLLELDSIQNKWLE